MTDVPSPPRSGSPGRPGARAPRWIGLAAVAGAVLVASAGLVISSFVIGLCEIGSNCSTGEDEAITTVGIAIVAVVVIAALGGAWYAVARRDLLLLAVLACIGGTALLLGGVAGAQAEVGTCERWSDTGAAMGFPVKPTSCELANKLGEQRGPLGLGGLLLATSAALLIADRRQVGGTPAQP